MTCTLFNAAWRTHCMHNTFSARAHQFFGPPSPPGGATGNSKMPEMCPRQKREARTVAVRALEERTKIREDTSCYSKSDPLHISNPLRPSRRSVSDGVIQLIFVFGAMQPEYRVAGEFGLRELTNSGLKVQEESSTSHFSVRYSGVVWKINARFVHLGWRKDRRGLG